MSKTMINMGNRIRETREARGMTQDEVVARAGISKSYLSDVENNKRKVGTGYLLKIAQVLGVSLQYLATGEPTNGTFHGGGVTIPRELQEAALRLKLSLAQTLDVLHAHDAQVAFHSDKSPRGDFDYWKKLVEDFKTRWGGGENKV